MSLDKLRTVFKEITQCHAWSLQLLRISFSKKDGVSYSCMEIRLHPDDEVEKLVSDICERYTNDKNGKLSFYQKVTDYDGQAEATFIYKLATGNELVGEAYGRLSEKVARPDPEGDPFAKQMNAYVLHGKIVVGGEKKDVTLVSMQNPITVIRNRFWLGENGFESMEGKVLTLRRDIDVVIFDDTVYLMNMSGETLFHMEHAYKGVCRTWVGDIVENEMVSNPEIFEKTATSGPHPRMFVSFDEYRYSQLKDPDTREEHAKMFKISIDNGKIDTSDEESAKRLVKVLCNKGMIDPFKKQPVEVSGARKWE